MLFCRRLACSACSCGFPGPRTYATLFETELQGIMRAFAWTCYTAYMQHELTLSYRKWVREQASFWCGVSFPGGTSGKEPACQCRKHKRHRFDPWVGKIPWRRAWQPTPVFLPGESHGQRSLAGYSPWGHKESDTTEAT